MLFVLVLRWPWVFFANCNVNKIRVRGSEVCMTLIILLYEILSLWFWILVKWNHHESWLGLGQLDLNAMPGPHYTTLQMKQIQISAAAPWRSQPAWRTLRAESPFLGPESECNFLQCLFLILDLRLFSCRWSCVLCRRRFWSWRMLRGEQPPKLSRSSCGSTDTWLEPFSLTPPALHVLRAGHACS